MKSVSKSFICVAAVSFKVIFRLLVDPVLCSFYIFSPDFVE